MAEVSHAFSWRWTLADLPNVQKNGMKVMSCFSCGGGSSMGYKLAGYEVVANVQIDPGINKVYNYNLHPKYSFNMDIRDFLEKEDLPEDLYNLDILDGSPPCSTFSMAGDRENSWNKLKVFREGQKKQRLDDLFFVFIALVKKLQPKVAVAQNVKGLLAGNAKGYVNEIIRGFNDAGYDVQLFLLNSSRMGVPQARERAFFIARRKDLNMPKISLDFNEEPIRFGEVRSEHGRVLNEKSKVYQLLKERRPGDKDISMIHERRGQKRTGFTIKILDDTDIVSTLTTKTDLYRMYDGMGLSLQDVVSCQTFPQDYDFGDQYYMFILGMSVPPVMTAQIAKQIQRQLFRV